MNSKPFFKSKTFWAAFIFSVFNVANYFGFDFSQEDANQIVNQDWNNLLNAAFGVLVIVLRVVTNKPMHFIKN